MLQEEEFCQCVSPNYFENFAEYLAVLAIFLGVLHLHSL